MLNEVKKKMVRVSDATGETRVLDVPFGASSLDHNDVFVVANGQNVYVWVGEKASEDEKTHAKQYASSYVANVLAPETPISVVEPSKAKIEDMFAKNPAPVVVKTGFDGGRQMFRLSDATGNLKFEEVQYGASSLDDNDVFVVNNGEKVYVWLGKKVSREERRHATGYGHTYITNTPDPKTPMSVVSSGRVKIEDMFPKKPVSKAKTIYDGGRQMFRLSDATGNLKFEEVQFGASSLDDNDVFVVNNGKEVFVWLGKQASRQERKAGTGYGHSYITNTPEPKTPMSSVNSGTAKIEDMFPAA
jgi:gelsolin